MTLKRYAGHGTLNIFSHHTNIDIKNRIVVFDIYKSFKERKRKEEMKKKKAEKAALYIS